MKNHGQGEDKDGEQNGLMDDYLTEIQKYITLN